MSEDPTIDEQRADAIKDVGKAIDILIAADGNLWRTGLHGSCRSLGKIISQLERWKARQS